MAKENTVRLYGYVPEPPKIRVNPETKEIMSGKIILTTIRRSYATKNMVLKGTIRWDSPCVLSRNEELIKEQMIDIKKGDMILVKGTLCTKEVPKRFICQNPECNHEYIKEEGVVVYVDPIFVKRIETGLTEEEALKLLENSDEISNEVQIIGTLCRDPQYYEDPETKKKECQFQIASNRKRRILEDSPDKKTDYPWVKSFGKDAEENSKALHTNSSVYINGAIETRLVKHKLTCEKCGQPYIRESPTTEIVPYFVEYLENCIIPEPTEEEGDDLDV